MKALYDWYRQTLRNPKYRWWIILATLAYFIMPFDILPDIFPIIGQVDDVLLMTLLVSEVSQLLIDRVRMTKGTDAAQGSDDAGMASGADTPVDVHAVSID